MGHRNESDIRRRKSRSPVADRLTHRSSRRSRSRSFDESNNRRPSRRPRSREAEALSHKSRSRERDRRRSVSRDRSRVSKTGDSRDKSGPSRRSRSRDKTDHTDVSKRKSDDNGTQSRNKEKKSKVKKEKKTKKKKKHSSSASESDSDSSVSSAGSLQLMQRLQDEYKKKKEAERRRKEEKKALETPEEKRMRRLAKKEAKERKKKEDMGWDNEHLHYTNTDNPFGDHDLLQTFVWKKKLDKEGMNDLTKEEIERRNRLLAEENKRELEKVKKRRLEKEREHAAREEEQALLQRQKEADQFQEWGKQEDVFHLEQARLRSKIRIKDGRAKPIDLLAQYISAEDEVDAIEMHEPYTYLNGLTIADLEDLLEDIKVYKELEMGKNLSYWNDITVIVDDELRKLRKLEQDDDYRLAVERREGINSAVAQDVGDIFKGKTAEKLEQLKISIQSKLDGSVHGLDISYWESLLSQLKAHIARARLRDRHQDNLKHKLMMLKTQQGVKIEIDSDSESGVVPKIEPKSPAPGPSKAMDVDENSQESVPSKGEGESAGSQDEEDDDIKQVIDDSINKYMIGSYSPKLVGVDDIEPGVFVIGEDEDNARLDMARAQVLNVGQKVEHVWTAEEKALENEAKKGITADEAGFSVESPLEQVYLWSDKYRPRKPRYFNRVHTGFEWNKYNQTHYDMDNPPPKIVQGYKFNIFYPDLIDKNTTPKYTVTACADNPDFAILRFIAGPPYEDIAFKVVNREWEYSYKRGFRCQFHNNIFQLWFHFKRYRYRR